VSLAWGCGYNYYGVSQVSLAQIENAVERVEEQRGGGALGKAEISAGYN
jgi:hypothetical protein